MAPLLLLLTFLACGPEKKLLRQDRREVATLADLADLYWSALRWSDSATAATCVPDEERTAFEEWFTSRQKDERLTEVTVLDVRLGGRMDPPQGGRAREAIVVVKTEGFSTSDQVMRTETVTQRWYRDEHNWYVEWP